ncbi:hypothetical protein C7B61_01535 [filamentous cyanobacterium CCP1]|nr:hypothetical protein C7B76_17555 [filamentous cyanobacterium CCP2]PSB68315.1 hypothetical protein C7B61_01535 [filamentous cyanobacterium CCP1]
MSLAKDDPAIVANISLPPNDLYSDEPPLETDIHLRQMLLLITSLEWLWRDRRDFFASGNLTIYYSPRQLKSRDFRGPDFFVVLDTERRSRKSWTVWEEDGKYPNVVIEILSESTADQDRGIKKQIYQNTFRTPEYFWFDPDTLELAGFLLVGGVYQPLQPNAFNHLWSQQLNLFLGVQDQKLRYFSPTGELIPTPEEAAELAQQQAELAQQQAELERQQKEAALARLKELEERMSDRE